MNPRDLARQFPLPSKHGIDARGVWNSYRPALEAPPEPADPLTLRESSVHEAGHAVMLALAGASCDGLWLHEDGRGECLPGEPLDAHTAHLVCAAGPGAQVLYDEVMGRLFHKRVLCPSPRGDSGDRERHG